MDIRHHYREYGQGYPLILLHGNGEDCSYFSNQIPFFSANYHVFALDTRGHGKTERGNQPFTIRQFAKDLLEFMDSNNIECANILGFSDGGNIAMIFAMEYPNRVNKLILNGANLDPKGVKWAFQMPVEIEYRMTKLFSCIIPKAKVKSEILGLMVNDPNIRIEDLNKIKAHTLVIAGTKDVILNKHTKLITHHIPNAMLKLIEGDHFIAKNNPSEFNTAVMDFLKRG